MKENIESPKNILFAEMKFSKLIDYSTCVKVAQEIIVLKKIQQHPS